MEAAFNKQRNEKQKKKYTMNLQKKIALGQIVKCRNQRLIQLKYVSKNNENYWIMKIKKVVVDMFRWYE